MAPEASPSLLERLKRRKVVQWTLAYLSGAWLVLQVVDVIGEQFDWPTALERGITVALGFGLVGTVIVAWYHGEKGHQRATRGEALLLGALVLFTGGALIGLARPDPDSDSPGNRAHAAMTDGDDTGSSGRRPPDPAAVAILPFAPATPDTALERLGRDLALTLAATLDGVGELRVVDGLTALARSDPDSAILSLAQARGLAAELGAGRLLRGSLTRVGPGVRIDLALYGQGDRPTTRASAAVQDANDLDALTDSAALALLRRLWTRPDPELPSPAALATRSGEALRAYVAGERAMARGDMPGAVSDFERAFALDSTYLFAYWRSIYPRVYEGSPADPEIMRRVIEHRDEFPAADRMLVDAHLTTTVRDRRRILEEATRRFPTHWPAWFTYANLLVHWAPYRGSTYGQARSALQRVVELNPGLAGAWEHLLWIEVHQRDTVVGPTFERLTAVAGPRSARYGEDLMTYYATTVRLVDGGGRFTPGLLEETAEYILGYVGPLPPEAFGVGLIIHGLPTAQVQVANAVLERGPAAELAAAMWRGKAYGWSGRGAWDSVVVALDRSTRMDGSWQAALTGYGLLATGAALGALDPGTAAAARPTEPSDDQAAAARAELAWLDGVVAFAREDRAAVDAARRALQATGGEFVPLLDASLEALALRLAGRNEEAVRLLLSAEESAADRYRQEGYSFTHPHVSTVDRVLLGRWLRDADRPADALRVLTWYGAVLPGAPPLEVVNRTAGRLGVYERARAEEAMGRLDDARAHYRRFVESMDRPVERIRPLVQDALERLQRLEPRLPG